jgi:hypothetical protein
MNEFARGIDMPSLNGLGATINDPEAMTHGKPCIIEYFDHKAHHGKGMWYVTFDAGWCGWYDRKHLLLDRDRSKS